MFWNGTEENYENLCKLYELVVQLMVLYSIVLLSSLVVFIVAVISIIAVSLDNTDALIVINLTCRIFYLLEQIANCVCLLFQISGAKGIYYIVCNVCAIGS